VIKRSFALLTLAAVLVACGSSTSSVSPAPSSAVAPSASPAPASLGSSPSGPTASSGPSDSPEPSVDSHGVPELEALLPAKVGDVALERLSLSGKDFYSTGTAETQARLDTFLASLGKTLTDLRVGDAGDPTGTTVLEVGAFQVLGTTPANLLSEWVASTQAANPGHVSVSNTTIDGRELTKLIDGTRDVGGTTYAYAKGDIVFLIAADDAALVSNALAQLPKP
jgi:hypothetical protein